MKAEQVTLLRGGPYVRLLTSVIRKLSEEGLKKEALRSIVSPYFVDFKGINSVGFLGYLEQIRETFQKKVKIMECLEKDEDEEVDEKDSDGEIVVKWHQVRNIPPTLSGWDPANDLLKGTEQYGDLKDDSQAWAKPFDHLWVSRYKVELSDGSKAKEYKKGQLYGKASNLEAILKDTDSLIDSNGAKVYIKKLDQEEKAEAVGQYSKGPKYPQ